MKDNSKTKEQILAEEKATLKIKPNDYTNTKAYKEFERKLENILESNKKYYSELDNFRRPFKTKDALAEFFTTHRNRFL